MIRKIYDDKNLHESTRDILYYVYIIYKLYRKNKTQYNFFF